MDSRTIIAFVDVARRHRIGTDMMAEIMDYWKVLSEPRIHSVVFTMYDHNPEYHGDTAWVCGVTITRDISPANIYRIVTDRVKLLIESYNEWGGNSLYDYEVDSKGEIYKCYYDDDDQWKLEYICNIRRFTKGLIRYRITDSFMHKRYSIGYDIYSKN